MANLYPNLGRMAHRDSDNSDVEDILPDEGDGRYLPVTQALRLISIKFDGKKSELREFIASVETAIEIVNPNERQLFLKFVESKITGDAKTKLLARPDRRTWEETKAIL